MPTSHLFISICFAFILFFAGPVHAVGTLDIGTECTSTNDSSCISGQCEQANSDDKNIDGKYFCVCGEGDFRPLPSRSPSCAEVYDSSAKTAESWVCKDGASFTHDLNYCFNTILATDSKFSVPPGDPSLLDRFLDPEAALVVDEFNANILVPQPRIKIPGLEFTGADDIVLTEDPDGNRYLNIPFFGEYLSAIYRYMVAMAGLAGVVMIIVASLGWITSGGSSEKIQSAKKKIIGLVLTVGSYTMLSVINPDLVQFRSLRVKTVTKISIDDAIIEDKDPSTLGAFSTGSPKPITDTTYDDVFKEFGNCIGADWRVLKSFAFKESALNASVVNSIGFVGLFQTKPPNCRDALSKYPEWKSACTNLTNPYVNTAVGAKMLESALKKIKPCGNSLSTVDGGALLYLNHNSGGGSVNYILKNGGCSGGRAIQLGIVNFWNQHKSGKYYGKGLGEKRYPFSIAVGELIQSQGVRNYWDVSANGSAVCPFSNPPPTSLKPKAVTKQSVAIVGSSTFAGGCTQKTGFVTLLKKTYPSNTFTCFAKSGANSDYFREQFDINVSGKGYGDLIIYGDLNGLHTSVTKTQTNLTYIFQEAEKQGMRVIVVGAQPFRGYKSWSVLKDNNIKENNTWLATKPHGVDIFIDLYNAIDTDGNSEADPQYSDGTDMLHFNAAGHTVLFNLISHASYNSS